MASEKNSELRLMIKAGFLYYEEDLNQRQVAERLSLSRPKVSRLLKRARKEGIVQISVEAPKESYVELETEIEAQFGLEEVLVASSDFSSFSDASALKQVVGKSAAAHLTRTIRENDVLGITWGTTLRAMVHTLHPIQIEGVRVVQTLGGVGRPEDEAHAADLSRRLAQLLGAQLTSLPVPGISRSKKVLDALLSDHHTRNAIELFSTITTAYVGIGSLATNPIFRDDPNISEAASQQLSKAGAVGDVALRFFDEGGHPVQTGLDDRIIGITLEQLQRVDRVVGVAGGAEKLDAIRGALRGQLVDMLVTDSVTAMALVGD